MATSEIETMPLAERVRPQTIDEMVGQELLVGENGVLRAMVKGRTPVRSMVLYGPPGCGKTTVALVLSSACGMRLVRLNATRASVADVRAAVDGAEGPVMLYLDEIQYFNKKQQQTLLPYVEDGSMVLVASTTENPYHDVNEAILSRCLVLELKPLTPDEVERRLRAVAADIGRERDFAPDAMRAMSTICSGDLRRALNLLELMLDTHLPGEPIGADDVTREMPSASMAGFDKDGTSHYSFISALQKSIRGSDPDAALFWLAKLLEGGDIKSPSRRLLVIAAEDVGLARPEAMTLTLACVQAAERLGLPEAYMPLSEAVVFLANAPKSASLGAAWTAARDDVRNGYGAYVPAHIASDHAPNYVWPHSFPYHWIDQQYMPDDLVGRRYYVPGDNRPEQDAAEYWNQVRNYVRSATQQQGRPWGEGPR